MRRAALTLACVAFTAGFSGSSAPLRKTKTFHSPVYGYTIEIPKKWSAIPADRRLAGGEEPRTSGGGVDVLGRHASRVVSEMKLPGLVIGAQAVPADLTLEDWTAQVTAIVASQKGCVEPAHADLVNVGSEVGMLLTYPDCPAELGYLHLWTTAVVDGWAFQIVLFDDPGHRSSDRRLLVKLLESVTFGEPASG